MTKNISQLLMLGLTALVSLNVTASIGAQETQHNPLVLTVRADRQSYLPGEAVQLTVSLANQSDATLKAGQPDPANGTLSLYLAFGEQRYQLYAGPDRNSRGELSRAVAELGAGEAFTVQTTMLYHRLRPTSHLTELYARPIREAELNDYFAFNRAGQYLLKAVYYDQAGKTEIESVPIEINVLEPTESDALVWESIKNDRDAAWFLHTGGLRQSPDGAELNQFVEKMRQLATFYPTSVHVVRFINSQKPVHP